MLKPNFTFLVLLVPCLLISGALCGQNTWTLKSSKYNISVYTSNQEHSAFKAFKAITIINNTDLNEIASILLDIKNYSNLIPDSKNSKIITKYSDSHLIHYMQTKVQWPFEDRDGIYELTSFYSRESEKVTIKIKCITSTVSVKKGVVRMTNGSGKWEIKKLDNNKVEIIYEFHADPAGQLPSWLVNSSLISVPQKTLLNLNKIVQSGKYKNAKGIGFIN